MVSFFTLILLFASIFLYFSLFSLICEFNCNWFIRFGFTYSSLSFFCWLCDLNCTWTPDHYISYYIILNTWNQKIFIALTCATIIIVMSSIWRWKTMCNSPLEINLVYSWSPPSCTRCKQVLMWDNLTFCEQGGTNQAARLLWPLVAMVLGDITECPSLLWP
jgi:hypothetical protein